MKKMILAIMIAGAGVALMAQKVTRDKGGGLEQILKRHSMARVEKPVETRVEDGVIVREYADGTIEKSAVSVFATSNEIKAQVERLKEDQKILLEAKKMIARMKRDETERMEGLNDSQIVKVADDVLATSANDSAYAGVIGALIGAAAAGSAAVAIGKEPKKDTEKDLVKGKQP
ncbi:MAG: hypothetical protein GX025_11030 [Clostridiales bacterium]|nr:hypothetical protein [Clostridiales bacterium]